MPAKDELMKSLFEQRNVEHSELPEIRNEWLRSLTVLYKDIASWLSESVAQNLLTVAEVPVTITEERIGTYEAPSLKIITPQGEAVHIVPRARIVVGAFGRVDLECSPRKLVLIRKDLQRWQLAQLAPQQGGWSFKELTEDSFWESLQYLLS